MINSIAPRSIHFSDRNGVVEEITIVVTPLPDTSITFPDADPLTILNAEVAVKSAMMSHVMQAEALDEIQLIYRLLWSADDYVQTRFNQAGFKVFKIRPGDVNGPMDIYS